MKQDAQGGLTEKERPEEMLKVGESMSEMAVREKHFLEARHCVKCFIGMSSFSPL